MSIEELIMERFANSIEQSLANSNWYAALAVALMLPDVCATLEHERTSGSRYREWFDHYVTPKYTHVLPVVGRFVFLSGGDCYAFRCSLLHEGKDDISHQRAKEVLDKFRFVTADKNGNIEHCNHRNNIITLKVDMFCRDMVDGTRAWSMDMVARPEVAARIDDLIQIHLPVMRL